MIWVATRELLKFGFLACRVCISSMSTRKAGARCHLCQKYVYPLGHVWPGAISTFWGVRDQVAQPRALPTATMSMLTRMHGRRSCPYLRRRNIMEYAPSNDRTVSSSVHRFDPDVNSWSTIASMLTARIYGLCHLSVEWEHARCQGPGSR
jgi:hypothetical protein